MKATPGNELTPNLAKAYLKLCLGVCLTAAVAGIEERYRHGHWWAVDYWISLLIPILVFPAAVCAMFVPRRIRWSENEFQIQTRFGRSHTLPWDRLHAYGSGNNVFLIQFREDVFFFKFSEARFDATSGGS